MRLVEVRSAYGVQTGRPKMDQKEFADILRVGHEAYRRWERGETQPNLETLANIRKITNIPLDWLICGIEEKPAGKPVQRPRLVERQHQAGAPRLRAP